MGTLIWRLLSGHSIDGKHRSNATWLLRGEDPTGRIHPWHLRPRLHRACIRTGSFLAVLAMLYGLVFHFALTLVILEALAAVLVLLGAFHTAATLFSWHHERHYVRPLEQTLTRRIRTKPSSVEVTLDDDDAVHQVAIEWPAETDIGEAEKQHVLDAVTERLAIESPDPSWRLKGRERSVILTHSDPPPAKVRWEQIEAIVMAARMDELLCGLGKKRAEVSVSTKLDSPHFGIAMGTGGGKSNTAAFWLVQELRRGSVALILDAKWFSHPWCFKDEHAEYSQLPNVAYARSTRDLHNAMVWLGIELQRRTEVAERHVNSKGDILGDVGPTMFIIAEELNLATPRLKQYWASIRSQDDPKRSPALDGMAAVSFAGRAVKMHLIVIGQMLTAATLGGGDVRENIGVRMLSRYTANSWKMQAGDLPMPPPSDIPGRVQVIASGTVRECQVPLMDFDHCRELAVSGTVTRCPDDMPGIAGVLGVPLLEPSKNGPDQGFVLVHGGNPGRPPGTLTLREAASEGLFTSLDAARKAVQRKELTVAGRDGSSNLYFISDLATTVRSSR